MGRGKASMLRLCGARTSVFSLRDAHLGWRGMEGWWGLLGTAALLDGIIALKYPV